MWRLVTICYSSKLSGRIAAAAMSSTSRDSGVPVSIPVPWGHIAGKAWGAPSGLPVLAVHGWLDNAGSFDKLIPLLSTDQLYVVAIDLPGHGQSSHRPVGVAYHFIDYIADLKYIIDGLSWKRCMILGHSLGAAVCSWFAAALPDSVSAMVLIEGLGPVTRPVGDDLPRVLGRGLASLGLQPQQDKIYPTWDAIVDRIHGGHKFDPQLDRVSAEVLAHRGTRPCQVEGGGYCFTRDYRLNNPSLLRIPDQVNEAFLQQIACPTLAIFTEDTFLTNIKSRAECVDKTKLTVLTVPGGHHVHLYNPEVMATPISTFLTTTHK